MINMELLHLLKLKNQQVVMLNVTSYIVTLSMCGYRMITVLHRSMICARFIVQRNY